MRQGVVTVIGRRWLWWGGEGAAGAFVGAGGLEEAGFGEGRGDELQADRAGRPRIRRGC